MTEEKKATTHWLTELLNCQPGKERHGGEFTGICEIYRIDGERIWWEGSFSAKDLGNIAAELPKGECLFFIKGSLPAIPEGEKLGDFLLENSAFILTKEKNFLVLQEPNPLKRILDIGQVTFYQINPCHLIEFMSNRRQTQSGR